MDVSKAGDGRKQRIYKTKEETSAPTVAIESLTLSCSIDAKEQRSVITADIPGAFMQADMDEVLYMKLEGPLAKLLTKVDPKKYEKFVEYEKGKPVMYVRLKKVPSSIIIILARSERTPHEMGIHCQPIRRMRDEQDDRRKTVYYIMAC